MSNLIPLEQAAQMLGVSVDRLNELRSNKQVFGYRDGKSWKFKAEELQRLADELEIKFNPTGAAKTGDSDFQLSDSSAGDALLLDDSDDLILDDSADSMEIKQSSLKSSGSKRPVDDDDDLLSFGDSSIDLAAESSKKLKAGSPELDDKASSSTGKLLAGGNSDDDLLLIDDGADNSSGNESVELSSDYDDSDLVLDDSDSSNELNLAKPAAQPGGQKKGGKVNLSASESGLSLSDEALELGGSDVDEFQLMADDADNDIISLSDSADLDAATLMQEDDFNLTPMEPGDGDESSGSQVIALEDSDLFAEDSAETMLGKQNFDPGNTTTAEPDFQPSFSPVPAATASAGVVEVPFTLWQVLGLAAAFLPLLIGGMVAYDLARNLWMPSDQVVASGPLQFFLGLFGQG